jgi:heterodisulfide reductase subunit C
MNDSNNYYEQIRKELVEQVEPNIYYCYQCGKCTAGCPLSDVYDWQPNEVIRLIQLGRVDSIINSNSVYLCVSCEICSSRCPQEVNIAAVMSHIRIKSWQYGLFRLKHISNFYKIFLRIAALIGRSYEPLLILTLNLLNKRFFNDFELMPGILKRRKIKLLPEPVKGRKGIAETIKKHL